MQLGALPRGSRTTPSIGESSIVGVAEVVKLTTLAGGRAGSGVGEVKRPLNHLRAGAKRGTSFESILRFRLNLIYHFCRESNILERSAGPREIPGTTETDPDRSFLLRCPLCTNTR